MNHKTQFSASFNLASHTTTKFGINKNGLQQTFSDHVAYSVSAPLNTEDITTLLNFLDPK